MNTGGNQDTSGTATKVKVTDNESANENNVITFVADGAGAGDVKLEADGDLTYNPSTGLLTVPQISRAKHILTSVSLNPSTQVSVTLSTDFLAVHAAGGLKTQFVVPAGISTVVVESSVYIIGAGSEHVYMALSGGSASNSSYSEFYNQSGASLPTGQSNTESTVLHSTSNFREIVRHSWTLNGLTPGSTLNVNLFAKKSGSKSVYSAIGGSGTHSPGAMLMVYYYDTAHSHTGPLPAEGS